MRNPFRNDDLGKLILRVTVGILILFHGVHKIINPGSPDFISKQMAGINLLRRWRMAHMSVKLSHR